MSNRNKLGVVLLFGSMILLNGLAALFSQGPTRVMFLVFLGLILFILWIWYCIGLIFSDK